MRLWSHNASDSRSSPDQKKDQIMEHERNKFDKRGKRFVKAVPLYGLAILILADLLLCTGLKKDISDTLSNLDRGISILLKIAISYFFFEAVSFLHRYQKQPPHSPAEKRDDVTKSAASTVAKLSDDSMHSISARMPPEPAGRQAEEAAPFNSSLSKNVPTTKESVCDQVEKHIPVQQQIYLDFQDTRQALDIIDGKRQGSIFLIPASRGSLIGFKSEKGSYLVLPYEEYLTETELRYSPVTACFEITGLTHVRQKVKVHCERPAILTETRDGLYEIAKKGQLTVVSVIE